MNLAIRFALTAITASIFTFAAMVPAAFAQGTAFTYQGRLLDSNFFANGSYNLSFKLFDAPTGGNQIGSTVTKNGTAVVGGLFTTELDFGASGFNGAARWLEISVNGTTLSPRQRIAPAPYAIAAAPIGNASGDLSGQYPNPELAQKVSSLFKVSGGLMSAQNSAIAALDQQQTVYDTGLGREGQQSFKPGVSGVLSAIEAQVQTWEHSNVNIVVKVFQGQGVNGTPIFTQTVPKALVIGADAMVRFDLTNGPFLMAGNTYTFSLSQPTNLLYGYSFFDTYPQGTSNGGGDLVFKTYMTTPASVSVLSGVLGVNTAAPQTTLDVNGTARMTGLMLPTGAGSGHVLTSDAMGNASWQPLSALSLPWAVTGSHVYNTNTGNVGIGTNAPGAKLDVAGGDIRIQSNGSGLVFPDASRQISAAIKPANVKWVAKSGGDFTSIQAALDSITDASADNPYLVKIAPGVFDEQIVMKPYAHIEGSGEGATRIRATASGNEVRTVTASNNAELRFLTVEVLSDTLSSNYGIYCASTSPIIKHVTILGSGPNITGVYAQNSAAPQIYHSIININGGGGFTSGIHGAFQGGNTLLVDTRISVANSSGFSTRAAFQYGGGTMTLKNCTLNGHTAADAENTGTLKLVGCEINGALDNSFGGTLLKLNCYNSNLAPL